MGPSRKDADGCHKEAHIDPAVGGPKSFLEVESCLGRQMRVGHEQSNHPCPIPPRDVPDLGIEVPQVRPADTAPIRRVGKDGSPFTR